jgi:acetyl-CoA synthetase
MTTDRRPSPSGAAFLEARNFLLRHRYDHALAVAQFRWPRLDHFNWALDYFDHIAAGNDAPALQILDGDGGQTVRSFAQMSDASNRVANFLKGLGAVRGDRLLVMLGNEVALWEVLLAAMKLGVVVTPATPLLTPGDLRDRIERGRVRHVVATSAHVEKFAEVPGTYTRVAVGAEVPGWVSYEASRAAKPHFTPDGPTRASDPLLLYFTSGTTSRPKLVMHTHQSYPIGHLSTLYWTGLRPGYKHWNISSPGWAKHAWSCFFTPWIAEATVFIRNDARFNARTVLETLVEHQVTSLCAPPTVWRMLIQETLGAYPVALKDVLSAGEPLNPEVIERVGRAWGVTIRDGYGQTETTALIGNSPGLTVRPGAMGQPLPGYPIVLLDPDGQEADEGEVCVRIDDHPVGLTEGYEDDAARTSAVMRDGLYHTGDIARREALGYLTFVGRTDDVFKASDYRLSPFELESTLVEHPAVAEAAVVPSPDPMRHAVPKAFVTLAPGYEPTANVARSILEYARDALAPYKRIRLIEFSDLPKTISGKIRRVDLRALEAERRASGQRGPREFTWDELFADM